MSIDDLENVQSKPVLRILAGIYYTVASPGCSPQRPLPGAGASVQRCAMFFEAWLMLAKTVTAKTQLPILAERHVGRDGKGSGFFSLLPLLFYLYPGIAVLTTVFL